jgi:23S rRNA (adenine2503-C2)-methyltransferase
MKPLFDVERYELAAQLVPSYRATQIFKSVYQRWAGTFEEMTDLPKQARSELAAAWNLQAPRIHRRFDSTDGTRRYLLRLGDGREAEAVFMPEERRDTICISCQVGCAVGCGF